MDTLITAASRKLHGLAFEDSPIAACCAVLLTVHYPECLVAWY
jgi:hypothetical protein